MVLCFVKVLICRLICLFSGLLTYEFQLNTVSEDCCSNSGNDHDKNTFSCFSSYLAIQQSLFSYRWIVCLVYCVLSAFIMAVIYDTKDTTDTKEIEVGLD